MGSDSGMILGCQREGPKFKTAMCSIDDGKTNDGCPYQVVQDCAAITDKRQCASSTMKLGEDFPMMQGQMAMCMPDCGGCKPVAMSNGMLMKWGMKKALPGRCWDMMSTMANPPMGCDFGDDSLTNKGGMRMRRLGMHESADCIGYCSETCAPFVACCHNSDDGACANAPADCEQRCCGCEGAQVQAGDDGQGGGMDDMMADKGNPFVCEDERRARRLAGSRRLQDLPFDTCARNGVQFADCPECKGPMCGLIVDVDTCMDTKAKTAESIAEEVPESEEDLQAFFGKKSCMVGLDGSEITVQEAKGLFQATQDTSSMTGGADVGDMGAMMLQCGSETELPPVTKVKAALELKGVTKENAEKMKPAIKAGIAKTLDGVPADQVRILGFKEKKSSGRRLQDGVQVDFEVVVPEGSTVTAEAVTSAVEEVAAAPAALVANVKEAVEADPAITVDTSSLEVAIPEEFKPKAVVVEEVKITEAPTPYPTPTPTEDTPPPTPEPVDSHAVAAAAALALLLHA